MKHFAIILSFFTIFLSGIPCDDEVVVFDGDISIVSPEHADDEAFHFDLCTPFDSCDCCATPITVNDIFVLSTAPESINTELNTFYISTFSKDFSNEIFQPPRV